MHKKIIHKLFIIITFVLFSAFVSEASNIELRVNIGQGSVLVDGKRVEKAKAYSAGGTYMVPLNPVGERIGADIEYLASEKAYKIKRNNRTIKFIIGKQYAFVDGVKKKITRGIEITNGYVMVPFRFLAEGLGGNVAKDLSTGELYALFPDKNYTRRFQYIKEGKIGDSYYGWTVNFPKGCSIEEKKTSGTSLLVKNAKEGYYFFIYNLPIDKEYNADNLLDEIKSYSESEKIIKERVLDLKGQIGVNIITDSGKEICECKAIVKDNRIYQIHLYTTDREGYFKEAENRKYRDVVSSFNINYDVKSKDVIDISEIRNDFYTYYEKSMGWEVDLPADMNLDVKDSYSNIEIFNEKGRDSGLTFGSSISLAQGMSLSVLAEDRKKYLATEINSQYISGPWVKDIFVNKIPAKKITYQIKQGENTTVFNDVLILNKDCLFHLYLYGENGYLNLDDSQISEKIIKSFKIPKNFIKNGLLVFRSLNSEVLIENLEVEGIKIGLPESWNIENKSEEKQVVAKHVSGLAEINVQKTSDTSWIELERRLEQIEKNFSSCENFNLISKENDETKGIPAKKLEFVCDIDQTKYYYYVYVFVIDDQHYCQAVFKVADVLNSDKNKDLLKQAWVSVDSQKDKPNNLDKSE